MSVESMTSEPGYAPPLVSVLMLSYNHAPYLAEAIESVLAQETDFTVELLIGEDCSTDGTAEIARRYQAEHPERIRLITSDANVGMHANHARLVRAARGTYLAFCEGDDLWHRTDKLARQVAFLRERRELVAVHSDFDSLARVGGDWRVIPAYRRHAGRPVPQGDVLEPLLSWCFIQTCTVLVEADVVRAFLASPIAAMKSPASDWSMFLFAAHRGRIGYLDESLATYRRTPGSAMNSGPQARLRMDRAALDLVREVCEYADVPAEVESQALRQGWAQLLVTALRAGDTATAREAMQWAQDHPPVLFRPARQWVHRLAVSSSAFRWLYHGVGRLSEELADRRHYRLRSAG